MTKKHGIFPYLILGALALIWGSSFVLMKKGLEAFDPVTLALVRLSVASLVLAPFLIQFVRKVPRNKLFTLFVVGFFGNGIPAYLFAKAETVIDSAVAGILNVLAPLSILIIGAIFFQAKFSRFKIVGVIMGMAGAVILIMAKAGEVNFFENVQYSLLVVLATVCYSVSANLMAYKLQGLGPIMITTFALSMIGWPSLVYLLVNGDFIQLMSSHPDAWASLGYTSILGAVGTAFAVVIFTRLLQMTDAVIASSVTYLIPIVALAWGLIVGEKIVMLQVAGMLVILCGVYLVNRK